ncbi:MAG: D-amino-acid transaminase [Pacificimonas sp.]
MPRTAYVDGQLVRSAAAQVSLHDRGFLLADGVYEVGAVYAGTLFDWSLHLERLARSLSELRIDAPMSDRALTLQAERLIAKNRIVDGLLYIQITRGAAPRDHAFPAPGTRPTLVMTVKPFAFRGRPALQRQGVTAVTVPDERWARRDIKSVALLPNVLAKQAAREADAYEAIMVADDGVVTEGSSTTVWMVDADGAIVTRGLSNAILPGSKRRRLMTMFADDGREVVERTYTLDELRAAREVWLTSASSPVMPVICVDSRDIGDGTVGPMAARACKLMWEEVERQTGWRAR